MTAAKSTTDWYRSRFEAWEKTLNGSSATALHGIRRAAFTRFGELGFPTTRQEEWRFTNTMPIASAPFQPVLSYDATGVRRDDIEKLLLAGLTASHLVFINGHISREWSSVSRIPRGVRVQSLATALQEDHAGVMKHLTRHARFDDNAFTALNTAFVQDGAFVLLPDNTDLEEPIHLVFIAAGDGAQFVQCPRNLIVTGKNCRLSIVETYHSLRAAACLTNVVSEVIAGENSVIEHDKLQTENASSYHIGTAQVSQDAGSTVVSNAITFGGAIARNSVNVVLDGEGAECTLNGLSVATGKQLIDNHTTIDHAKPRCSSHELYKSILDGSSRGVFSGKIIVRKDAQKTDAKQTNKTLLLSDGATIDTKPQLEIFADDVKCTHGATVGQLEEEQVFYLRSRGIPLEAARDILTFAFASDVVNRVHVQPLREQLDVMLRARLRQGRVAEEH